MKRRKFVPHKAAMAIGAHPDDIEFMMGGTLLLLTRAGYQTHYLSLANGSCGSAKHSAGELRQIRRREGKAAAKILGAVFHESLVDDLDIYYERPTLKRLAALIRKVNPQILLVPSPQDYMEDHTNTCRLAVTAAFTRGMRNFVTHPRCKPVDSTLTVYHAMPHGLRDSLRRRVTAGSFVNTTSVHDTKTEALAEHRSQQHWLGVSQKMNQYLQTADQFSIEVGRMSGIFAHAEGWRRHLHYGFSDAQADPLREALGANCRINKKYEAILEVVA
jgi:LmbE family N-acetylglucosaminyl deacetylase